MVSYVVVTYNTSTLTKNAVQSILEHCSNAEVIVVDNDSKDDTVDVLNSSFKDDIASGRLIVVDTKVNNGFSKGNNIGASKAKGDYYIFINPDTIVSSDLSVELANTLETKYKGKDVLLGPKILNPDNTPQHSVNNYPVPGISIFVKHFLNKLSKNKKYHSVDWLTGVCYCVNKKTYEKIGGWNEHYDLYSEDLDFCYQIKKMLKGKVIISNECSIIHYGNQSGKQIYKTSFASFEKKTNSLRKFFNLYYNDKKFFKWLKFNYRFSHTEEIKQYLDKYLETNY